ncbi:hypothetical protein, partial [Pontiella agarivorans]
APYESHNDENAKPPSPAPSTLILDPDETAHCRSYNPPISDITYFHPSILHIKQATFTFFVFIRSISCYSINASSTQGHITPDKENPNQLLEPQMNSSEYKMMTAKPNVLRRSFVEETISALTQTDSNKLIQILEEQLQHPSIPKPNEFAGSKLDEWIELSISEITTEEIVEQMGFLEVAHVSKEGETTPLASKFGAMLDVWNTYEK